MALTLPFLNGSQGKKRSQIIAVDLGSRTTKAVLLERRGDVLALTRYALLDAPASEIKHNPIKFAEHLRAVANALGNTTKHCALTLGVQEAMVKLVDFPQIPLNEMRQVLKINHKNYLQQELPNHLFDCHILPPRSYVDLDKVKERAVNAAASPLKLKVLATAAKQNLVNELTQSAMLAGLSPVALVPNLIGPVNAFELASPEIFAKETVALIDIGFKQTTVCILDRGQLVLNRLVNIGGDHLTIGLADQMNISYAEAEGIKVGMAPEVETAMQLQVIPLGREIRASFDFFEHQNDRPVLQVYLSGGSGRSELVQSLLQSELGMECKTWNPTGCLQLALPGQQAVDIEHVGPQLTVAIGTSLAAI